MRAYRFDPDLAIDEMTEICTWARANNLVPETIPSDARVTVDDGQITVEVHIDLDGNPTKSPRFDADYRSFRRGTVTVPLLVDLPTFEALKPIDLKAAP